MTVTRRMLERTELKLWVYRYPRIARFYLPVAYLLLLLMQIAITLT